MKIIIGITVILWTLLSNSAFAVDFSLFGDSTLKKTEKGTQFNLDGLNLSVEQEVSDTSYVLAEILFEFTEESNSYLTTVTRFAITHKLTPNTEIYAGKFVKGLGLWHQTFHYGSLALDTISLPFFIGRRSERQSFIATQITGMGITSRFGDFSYQFALGNNPGIDSSQTVNDYWKIKQLDRNSPGNSFSPVLKLNYSFNWKSEISLFAQLREIIELDTTSGATSSQVGVGDPIFDQRQFGVNFLYAGTKFSTFFEYYLLTTKDNTSIAKANDPNIVFQRDSYDATMYYLQLGWKFSGEFSMSVRHEGLNYTAGNTFFQTLGTGKQFRNVLGLNFRFDESNAVRFEVKQIKYDDTIVNNLSLNNSDTQYGLQWFFLLL